MVATIALPRLMRVGERAFEQLPLLLRELGLSKPLIVTDAYLNGTGRIAQAVEMLALSGIDAGIFADTVPDPTVESVMAGVRSLSNGEYDCVVGIGGGSPIDTAKAIAVIGRHGGVPADYKVPHVQDIPGLPIIAVPTTAGSGSEATRFTVITDGSTDEKMLCAGIAYLPIAAVIDYELTLTKPRRLTADTGIDSLTHAIEAYVSQRANPLSDRIALAAMELIAPNLRRVLHDRSRRQKRAADWGRSVPSPRVRCGRTKGSPAERHRLRSHGSASLCRCPPSTVGVWSASIRNRSPPRSANRRCRRKASSRLCYR
ncbi:MAG: iron-containing alcohol dehydrogenase, partial [Lysobacteraceae bacterium]